MGDRNQDHLVKEKGRQTFVVPGASGDYAEQRITLGAVSTGVQEGSFLGVTAVIESGPTGAAAPSGAVAELWLPRVVGPDEAASVRTDADYFYAGVCVASPRTAAATATGTGATVSFGMGTWPLAGWPGAQIRVRSGGNAGSMTVSATAF